MLAQYENKLASIHRARLEPSVPLSPCLRAKKNEDEAGGSGKCTVQSKTFIPLQVHIYIIAPFLYKNKHATVTYIAIACLVGIRNYKYYIFKPTPGNPTKLDLDDVHTELTTNMYLRPETFAQPSEKNKK